LSNLIRRIILSEINLTKKKEDFGWRGNWIDKPGREDAFNKRFVYTFKTEKYKYIVHSEEYDEDFYIISFFPKLSKDFFDKQDRLRDKGEPYYDKYSYKTKENRPKTAVTVLSILVDYVKSVLKENPDASFGYFGAADVHTGDVDADMFNTKRMRVYEKILKDEMGSTHDVKSVKQFSGGLILNKKKQSENPDFDLLSYGQNILTLYLNN
jgi:hypothetical protein